MVGWKTACGSKELSLWSEYLVRGHHGLTVAISRVSPTFMDAEFEMTFTSNQCFIFIYFLFNS